MQYIFQKTDYCHMLELPMLSNSLGWLEIPAPSSKNISVLEIFLHTLAGFVQVSAEYLPGQWDKDLEH